MKKSRCFIFSHLDLALPSPVEKLSSPLLNKKQITLLIKRDDIIHPQLSGNKWRKLKYNLIQAKREKCSTLLTFGGAYSNHIHAVSATGKLCDFKTIGVVRGEPAPILSPTLAYAKSQGMHLHFVSRKNYRLKSNVAFIEDLKKRFGDFYLLPEGGSNKLALIGVGEIIDELEEQIARVDYICSACGTGGTLAGLIKRSVEKNITVLGFPVLKNADWMYQDILKLLDAKEINHWTLVLDYHFGGYAKYSQQLIDFMSEFNAEFGIRLEQVYTAKMMYGLFALIEADYFPAHSTIVALHTGGLQGLLDIKEK